MALRDPIKQQETKKRRISRLKGAAAGSRFEGAVKNAARATKDAATGTARGTGAAVNRVAPGTGARLRGAAGRARDAAANRGKPSGPPRARPGTGVTDSKTRTKTKGKTPTNAQVRTQMTRQAKGGGPITRTVKGGLRLTRAGMGAPIDSVFTAGAGVNNMEDWSDVEGFSEGAVENGGLTGLVGQEIGRGAAAMQGYITPEDQANFDKAKAQSMGNTDEGAADDSPARLRRRLDRQQAQLAQLDDKTGPLANELMTGIDVTRARLREAGGRPVTIPEAEPEAGGGGAISTASADDSPVIMDDQGPQPPATTPGANGRDRLQRDRPRTFGRPGTTIDAARADEPEAAQLQSEVTAPGLPGVPESEQEIIRVQDGSGTGVVRAPAGLRQGGGTFSTVDSRAFTGLRSSEFNGIVDAARAAQERGDWETSQKILANLRKSTSEGTPYQYVPPGGSGGEGETRRERLRREIRQTQGLDQSFTSMMREGLRRRSARSELDAMDAQAIQDSENAAAMARERLGRQPTALEIAEEARESAQQARENDRADREEYRDIADRLSTRMDEDNNEYVDTRYRNRLEGLVQRSGWSRKPENIRAADDAIRITDALNDALAEENELQIADIWGGGPDNPFSNVKIPVISQLASALGLAGNRPPDKATIQQRLATIGNMAHSRTDDDLIWDDQVVDIDGTEIELRDIPKGIRDLIDHNRARLGVGPLENPDAPRTD